MKIAIVLHNIRSVYNVGAILRTCDGLGVEKAVFSGYTPRHDDQELLPHLRAKLNRQIEKSALGAEKTVAQVKLPSDNAENGILGKDVAKNGAEEGENSTNIKVAGAKALTKYIKCSIMEGYTIVGLENNLAAEELPKRVILGQKTDYTGQKVDFGEKILLILGEEVHGIPAEIRSLVDYFLEIPMRGVKESFNVSVATGIALWGLLNCY